MLRVRKYLSHFDLVKVAVFVCFVVYSIQDCLIRKYFWKMNYVVETVKKVFSELHF